MGYYIAASVGALIGFVTVSFLLGINGRAKPKRLNTGEIKSVLDDIQDEGYRITAKGNERVSNAEIAEYISGRCIICNTEIPEGRQVCPVCERKEQK